MSEDHQNKQQIKVKESWEYASKEQTEGRLLLREEYDKAGNKIRETTYNKEKLPVTETTWQFNLMGDIVSQSIEYFDKNEKLAFHFKYEYNKMGQKTKAIKRNQEKEIIQAHYFKYNNETEEKIFVAGELNKTRIYSKEGLLIEEISHANQFKVLYQYDNRGTLIRRKEKRLNRPVKIIDFQNAYDQEGRLVRRQAGNEVIEFEYNLNNDVSKQRRIRTGKVDQILVMKYEYFN